MLGILFSIAKIAALVYLGLCAWLYVRQASYIYFPTRQIEWDPAAVGLAFEDVRLSTSDGESVAGWYVPVAGASQCILFSHGNAGNIGGRVDSVKLFHELGFSVLIFDYRGYGQSTGRPTEQGTYLDAEAAWEHLVNVRKFAPEAIIVFGRSLGGGIASWVATEKAPGRLILESPFASVPAMASEIYPFLPAKLLCRFSYDTLSRMTRVKCPVLVIHSRDDDVVPYHHGRRVFDAAREPKSFHELRGGHNAAVFDEAYRNTILAFCAESNSRDDAQRMDTSAGARNL